MKGYLEVRSRARRVAHAPLSDLSVVWTCEISQLDVVLGRLGRGRQKDGELVEDSDVLDEELESLAHAQFLDEVSSAVARRVQLEEVAEDGCQVVE